MFLWNSHSLSACKWIWARICARGVKYKLFSPLSKKKKLIAYSQFKKSAAISIECHQGILPCMDTFKTIRNNTIALHYNILKLNFNFSSRKNSLNQYIRL